ncbi:hypothetical protein [Flavobacterium sp. AJR]|uniref:hypothetical protein n=1 Tax=Flavobacterium sp. AJR TaxID=1979369 RepID=UPI000A3D74F2|nr:hypothetical protein [Flavobacterium sp. AJR]OUL64402.1 hypothetical protein B8T70_00275 [Flavobacterium sp. AJR]
MKIILSSIFCLFSVLLFSQNENKAITGFSKEEKADSIKVENKSIGYSNTGLAKIKGKTFDRQLRSVESVEISLTNLSSKITSFYETNDDGLFDINIERGVYSILFSKDLMGNSKLKKSILAIAKFRKLI